MLYHLAARAEWESALAAGSYRRSTLDRSLEEEGYIHCSFAAQVQGVADRYYRGRPDIVLLTIDPARLTAPTQVEDLGSGEAYPHVYGPLDVDAVVRVDEVPLGVDGRLAVQLSGCDDGP